MKILDIIDGIGEVIVSSAERVYRAIPKRGKRERDKRMGIVKEELAELKDMEEGKEIEEEVGERPSVVKVEKAEEDISEEELEEEEKKIREKISTIGETHVVVDTGEGTGAKRIVRHDLKGPFLTRFKKFIKLKKTRK